VTLGRLLVSPAAVGCVGCRSIGGSARASPRVKRNGPSVGGPAEAVPDRLASRRWAHPTVPRVHSDNGSSVVA
jgi:hypothetical protein